MCVHYLILCLSFSCGCVDFNRIERDEAVHAISSLMIRSNTNTRDKRMKDKESSNARTSFLIPYTVQIQIRNEFALVIKTIACAMH